MFLIRLSDTRCQCHRHFTCAFCTDILVPKITKVCLGSQNSHSNLSAKNGQKLYSPHSQTVKAAKNELPKKQVVDETDNQKLFCWICPTEHLVLIPWKFTTHYK